MAHLKLSILLQQLTKLLNLTVGSHTPIGPKQSTSLLYSRIWAWNNILDLEPMAGHSHSQKPIILFLALTSYTSQLSLCFNFLINKIEIILGSF